MYSASKLEEAIAQAKPGDVIKLGADIVLTEAWTPAGTEEAPFVATLDGQGYTISGLSIDGEEGALFGYVADGAVIKNVNFADVNVSGKHVSVVAYVAKAATIENVNVLSGSLTATGYGASIVNEGYGTTIKDCDNYATIDAKYAAGIAGWLVSNATVDSCNNYGDITSSYWAGGICMNFNGTMTNCVNDGDVTVSGGMPAGGIIARVDAATTIANCTNNGAVTNTGTDAWNSSAAGILGQIPSTKYTATINSCTNNGDITASAGAAAGIGVSLYGSAITATDCVNNGALQGGASAKGNVF